MVESRREKKTKNGIHVFNIYLIYTATQYILNTVFLLLYHYFLLESGRNRPIANMATISPKRGFSVATVAKGWSLVYMLMRVCYLVVFSLWKQ